MNKNYEETLTGLQQAISSKAGREERLKNRAKIVTAVWLYENRTRLNLSISEVAKKSELSYQTISKIENREVSVKLATLIKIANKAFSLDKLILNIEEDS